jgi:hypothetical protein
MFGLTGESSVAPHTAKFIVSGAIFWNASVNGTFLPGEIADDGDAHIR